MVKIQKLPNGQLVLTIPKRLAELISWDKGTEIIFKQHEKDSFIIQKKKPSDKNETK